MKKNILMLMLLTTPVLLGQSIFDKYEVNNEVSFFSISPRMFQMLASMEIETSDPEADQFLKLVANIESFKVLRTDDDNISKDFINWVDSHSKKERLEELMRVRDQGNTVKFFVKEGEQKNYVKELLMCVSGAKMEGLPIGSEKPQTVLLMIRGNIALDQISQLTKKMDLPGSKELEELNKSKNQ